MLITAKVIDQHVLLPVGWYSEEIQTKTEFLISIEVKYETSKISDELNNLIDYQFFSDRILALKNSSFKLIETVAESLINEILNEFKNQFKLHSILVRIKKMNILNEFTAASHHEIVVEKLLNS